MRSKRLAFILVAAALIGILVIAGTALASVAPQTPTTGADLAITMTDTPDPVGAGTQLTYTLKVTNNGPDVATGVALADSLPTSTSLVSVTFTQGTCTVNASNIACALGDLAKDASATVTIVVVPGVAGPLANTATVSSTSTDPVATNNTAAVSTTVNPVADVGVAKADSPDPVVLGGNVTYTLMAANAGPSPATGVTITDNLPTAATFVSATPSQGSCARSEGVLTCNLGTLAASASATVTVVMTPSKAGLLHNTATIAAAEFDPQIVNNTSTADTRVDQAPGVDLAITKSDSPDPVLAGSNVTYTLNVVNKGQVTATGVVVTDDLPSEVAFVSATASQGACTRSGATVTCTIGSLAKDASATVSIVVTATTAGTIRNTARVSANEADHQAANNTTEEKTRVVTTPSEAPGKIKLTGTVQALPQSGLIGTWTIQGLHVSVTADTKVEGAPAVGSFVKVEGTVDGQGVITARSIEVQKDKAQADKETRPGHGYGDENHEHSGPPGLADGEPKAGMTPKLWNEDPQDRGQARGHEKKQ